MATDIYKRPVRNVGGVFSVESSLATFSGGSGTSAGIASLVQQVQWNYPRDVKYIYEIGSTDEYRVLGRTRGSLSIGRIVGANGGNIVDEELFDACDTGGTMTISAKGQLCNGKGATVIYTFSSLFVVDFGGTISVEDQMIRENVQLTFSGLAKSTG